MVYAVGLLRRIRAACPHVGPILGNGTRVPAIMYPNDIEMLADIPAGMALLLGAVSLWCPAHDMVT